MVEDPEHGKRNDAAEGGLNRDCRVIGDDRGGARARDNKCRVDAEQSVRQSADVEIDCGQPRTEPGEGKSGQEQRPALNSEAPGEESAGRRSSHRDPPTGPGMGVAGLVFVTIGEGREPPPDDEADQHPHRSEGGDEEQVVVRHRRPPSCWCRARGGLFG